MTEVKRAVSHDKSFRKTEVDLMKFYTEPPKMIYLQYMPYIQDGMQKVSPNIYNQSHQSSLRVILCSLFGIFSPCLVLLLLLLLLFALCLLHLR